MSGLANLRHHYLESRTYLHHRVVVPQQGHANCRDDCRRHPNGHLLHHLHLLRLRHRHRHRRQEVAEADMAVVAEEAVGVDSVDLMQDGEVEAEHLPRLVP